MKLCKDCRFCSEPGVFAECLAPQNMKDYKLDTNILVMGEPAIYRSGQEPRWIFCSSHRDDGWLGARIANSCGAEGRWWQKK